VVNTLVMAYAGAALPLLLALALSGRDLGEILTAQQVAQEVVRTLVGSIGLVAAVPITTALAALVAGRESFPAPPAQPEDRPDPVNKPTRRIADDMRIGYDPAKGPWLRPGKPTTRTTTRARRAPAPTGRRSTG
jgi:hypothetical protein